MGQVTAMDGSMITLALGSKDGSAGGKAPEMQDGEGMDGGPDGMGGQRAGGFTLSGEEMTITVDDATVITISGMAEDTKGSISDISEGDILTVTISGDTVTAITIGSAGGGMGGEMPAGGCRRRNSR